MTSTDGSRIEHGESRWPAIVAVVVALVLQWRVPEELSFGPSFVTPVISLGLLVPLLIANPSHFSRHTRDMRWLSLLLVAAMNVGNVSSLVLLLHRLLDGSTINARSLIRSAVEIWLTSVVVFALWYWELDRGGPVVRAQARPTRDPDFLFAQMSDASLTSKPWTPMFIDYLYVSLTNSTAFSPTDTMPLSRQAKAIMASQSLVSLATIAFLGARAVNILGTK